MSNWYKRIQSDPEKRQIVCEGNFGLQKRCHNLNPVRFSNALMHPHDIQRLRETVSGTDGFLDRAKRYTDITELTPELLRLFIEKIVVYEKGEVV